MAGTFEGRGREARLGGQHLRRGRLDELGDAESLGGRHALAMARGVEAVDEGVLGVGVEDPEMRAGRQWHGREDGAAAVDEHEVVLPAEAGHALIEDAAGHAHEVVFRVPADFHEGFARGRLVGGGEEREARRELDRGAAAKAGAGGEIGHREVIETGGRSEVKRGQRGDHAERVVDPRGRVALLREIIGAERNHAGFLAAGELTLAIVARGEGDPHAAVDRGAEDRAAVIIGVVADELDPAGGARPKVWRNFSMRAVFMRATAEGNGAGGGRRTRKGAEEKTAAEANALS